MSLYKTLMVTFMVKWFESEGRVVGPSWEKLKPKGPKGRLACRWAMLGELKPKGPKGFRPTYVEGNQNLPMLGEIKT